MSQRPVLRSPLKDKTLRNPGQSLDAEISKAADKFMENGMSIVWLGIFVLFELFQWLTKTPAWMAAIMGAIFLLVLLVIYIPKMMRGYKELKRLRQARDGERAVAECLDLLRGDGHRVFHDIVGPNFNIDHVIIGPKGIFTVETKTLSKYVDKNDKLYFDGEHLRIGKIELPNNPVPQARAQAGWFKKLLGESTGKTFGIKPVVVFPGWFVERTSGTNQSDIWVLEPKALRGFLKNEPVRIKSTDVDLAVFHLKRYIRASNA